MGKTPTELASSPLFPKGPLPCTLATEPRDRPNAQENQWLCGNEAKASNQRAAFPPFFRTRSLGNWGKENQRSDHPKRRKTAPIGPKPAQRCTLATGQADETVKKRSGMIVASRALNPDGEHMRLPTYFNVHLVSDSTGETLNAIMRASTALFSEVEPVEHNYYLVRSQRQLERVMSEIENAPGIVFFTISSEELRETLEHHCRRVGVPALSVLDNAVNMLSRYLGLQTMMRTAGQHTLDANYFRRMEAINFALSHDDGQGNLHLAEADVVLVGVSRTSKTPTCVYLANRGVRAANVPLVPGIEPPAELLSLDPVKGPLVVGLKISVERLLQIRHARLLAMQDNSHSDYADEEQVRLELRDALRLFDRQKWPVLDVSRRSVEETAAAILNLLTKRKSQ